MKKAFTSLFVILTISGYSQNYWYYDIDFEDTSQLFRIEIDTNSNPDNVWQIGAPQKTLFTTAYSFPNAIVTDTLSAYPTNDTSRFIIMHVAEGGFYMPHTVILGGKYQIDSDSLIDFGTIEFSPDNGITWIDLLIDTVYQNQNCYAWWSNEPILTGKSNGWVDFYVWLAGFGPVFNIYFGDTVQYRFTFTSDSIQTNKDGLIFDNLHFEDWMEGIQRIQNDFKSIVFPNPTSGKVKIEFDNEQKANHQLSLYNMSGQSIIMKKFTNSNQVIVDLSNDPSGEYFYLLKNTHTGKISSGKILKN